MSRFFAIQHVHTQYSDTSWAWDESRFISAQKSHLHFQKLVTFLVGQLVLIPIWPFYILLCFFLPLPSMPYIIPCAYERYRVATFVYTLAKTYTPIPRCTPMFSISVPQSGAGSLLCAFCVSRRCRYIKPPPLGWSQDFLTPYIQ
jgi:hypothetical protein